jgi:hypothetical protein
MEKHDAQMSRRYVMMDTNMLVSWFMRLATIFHLVSSCCGATLSLGPTSDQEAGLAAHFRPFCSSCRKWAKSDDTALNKLICPEICAELRDDLVLPTSQTVKGGLFDQKWDANVRVGLAAFFSGVNVTGLVQFLGESGIRASSAIFQKMWPSIGKRARELAPENFREMRLDLLKSFEQDIVWVRCKQTKKRVRMLKVQISLDGAGKS